MTQFSAACRIAATLCLLAGGAEAQQGVALSADQMRGFASQLLREGDAPRALAVTEALLNRNPQDIGALLVRAQAALAIGEHAIALDAASRAFGAADTGEAKFVAARLAARSHAELQQDTRAQIWLRRARQHAPDATQAQDVAEDYRFLRNRNPWATQLRFGITPSSNVNNGSSNEIAWENTYFGYLPLVLNNEAQALDGVVVQLGAQVSYRLQEAANYETTANASFDVNRVVLSSTSERLLQEDRVDLIARALRRCEIDGTAPEDCDTDFGPINSGADYSTGSLSFGLTHRRIFAEGSRPVSFGIRAGQTWYGGEAYSQFLTTNVSQSWRIAQDQQLAASAFVDWRAYEGDRPGSYAFGTNASWTRILASGDRFGVNGGYRVSVSDADASHYKSARLGVSYDLSDPIAGVLFGLTANYEHQYAHPELGRYAGREDDTLSGSIDARLPDYEIYGFQPVVSLNASKTDSVYDRFDQQNLSLGFDLRSSF